MALQIGALAPDFTLYSSDKEMVTLSDLKGKKVVLLFFPLAFTSVCTTELCEIRDNLNVYNELDAIVLGISVDSMFTLQAYKEQQNLNFTLLSDFNKEVSIAYDTLYDTFFYGMQGVSKRSAFIIDEEMKIRYAEILENAGEVPNFAAIKQELSSLQMKIQNQNNIHHAN